MKTELDSLATALRVKTHDRLRDSPQLAPWRPTIGIAPQVSGAKPVTLAIMQAMLGFTSKARWLRHACAHLRHLPYLPQQSGYNKRLRKAAELIRHVTRALARDTTLWSDDVWVVDSPSPFALTGAQADERGTLLDLLGVEPQLTSDRPRQTLIGDKNYFGREFEQQLSDLDIRLLRQVIESINETFKGQFGLERHRGRTPGGVAVRVLQRILALTAAIRHSGHNGQPVVRALTAHDH